MPTDRTETPFRESTMLRPRFLLLAGMIFAAAFFRLIPHPWNIAPVGAVALFGGAHFSHKRWAFLVPLLAMLCSDVVLYATRFESYRSDFLVTASFVYGSFALIVGLGLWLQRRRTLPYVALATLAGSVLFFLVTNFGVWLCFNTYPKTLSGLWECYVAAIPFFHNTLLSDAVGVTVLFGGFALAEKCIPALHRQPISIQC